MEGCGSGGRLLLLLEWLPLIRLLGWVVGGIDGGRDGGIEGGRDVVDGGREPAAEGTEGGREAHVAVKWKKFKSLAG